MASPEHPDPEVGRLRQEVETLRGAVAELTLLNEVSREIGALVDLGEVLRRIVDRSVGAVGAEEGVITLVDDAQGPSGQTLVRAMATDVHRGPFHLNEQILGWMQLYRAPLRVGRSLGDERFRQVAAKSGVTELLSVPLLARGRLIGVLTVCNRKAGGSFGESDQRLLSIIGSQSAQIIENARLYEEEQALRQMQDELRVAFQIQTRLLPESPPQVLGYDLAGLTIPAQAVGGDFFDYIPIGGPRLSLCVGDVSGKGLPAALLMATAQATIRGQAVAGTPPDAIVAGVNGHMYRSVKRGNFLTLFYCELLVDEDALAFVNAGHNRPLLLRSDGEIEELRTGGLAIGLTPKATYQEGRTDMHRGDVLVIFSDGVTEARDRRGEEFGADRLAASIRRHAGESAAALIESIVSDVRAFASDADAADDITLLGVIRN